MYSIGISLCIHFLPTVDISHSGSRATKVGRYFPKSGIYTLRVLRRPYRPFFSSTTNGPHRDIITRSSTAHVPYWSLRCVGFAALEGKFGDS